MLIIADFIINQNRWLGNYVLPIIGVIGLFVWFARAKVRPAWLTGATVAVAVFVVAYATFRWFVRLPDIGLWLLWYSALPIQSVCNFLLGEDNVVEEHFLIPTAVLMWSAVGLGIGWTIGKIRSRPNQSPQRNAGSRPPSDVSPASETPSSLGPRG